MQTKLINLGIVHPAPNTSGARRQTDWSKLSNENLKFALDLLSLHRSPFEVDVANEIQERIDAGTWLDLEKPPPTFSAAVPAWLSIFPFSLLWRQGRGK
jgi:hypothetical protein